MDINNESCPQSIPTPELIKIQYEPLFVTIVFPKNSRDSLHGLTFVWMDAKARCLMFQCFVRGPVYRKRYNIL